MATLEELVAEELADLKAGDTIYKATNGVKKPMTDEDLEGIANIRGAERFDLQENGWKYARQAQYASIEDQLDMMYHDEINGTTTWKDHIAQVKSDNPKP
jgi:hypothetical protein